MIDLFAAADAREDVRLFVEPVRRDQDRDRLADRFLGGVPENTFGGGIPGADDSIEVLADDGVVRGFHDGNELLRGLRRLYALDA